MKRLRQHAPAGSNRPALAFTLIEILVSMVILLVLGLLISQVLTMTSDVTRLSNRKLDSLGQARVVFDRMEADWMHALARPDAPRRFGNPNASGSEPWMAFLSEVPSSVPNARGVSLVGYRMAAHPDLVDPAGATRPCLQRGVLGLDWNDPAFFGIGANGETVPQYPIAASEYDILSDGVVRVALGYLLKRDTQSILLDNGTADGQSILAPAGQSLGGTVVYLPPVRAVKTGPTNTSLVPDLRQVEALVVTLVVVDSRTAGITPAARFAQLAAALSDPATGSASNDLVARQWTHELDQLRGTGQFEPLLGAARVFQRAIAIPTIEP